MYIDINAIPLYPDLDIFQQDKCFCSKLGMEVEHTKNHLKTSRSQIWVICQLLPFVLNGTPLKFVNALLALVGYHRAPRNIILNSIPLSHHDMDSPFIKFLQGKQKYIHIT